MHKLWKQFILSSCLAALGSCTALAADTDILQMPMDSQLICPLTVPPKSIKTLGVHLEDLLTGYDGSWSIYIKDLSNGDNLTIYDKPMKSASIMKLFILGAVYASIDANTLERTDELTGLMSSMISASSNSAANALIMRLGQGDFQRGIDTVNAYIQRSGYSRDTVLHNGFQEESLILDPRHTNQTSAQDVGLLLERIYHRSFGRRAVCNEIETWLLAQETRYKIPKALPGDVLVANKTGETDEVENDCATIYTPSGDYILCVFSSDWADKSLAQSRVTELSGAVYSYFSDEHYVEHTYHLPILQEGDSDETLG